MKGSILKIGGRTTKTVIAVFLCFVVDSMRESSMPFYATIAAVLCIQRNPKDSFQVAINREVATIIGGIWGMAILLIERNIYTIPNELLRYLFLSIMLVPIINFSVLIKQEKGTFLMCVVFLCITVTHGNDESPLTFALSRIMDTTIGIAIALFINQQGIKKSENNSKKFINEVIHMGK